MGTAYGAWGTMVDLVSTAVSLRKPMQQVFNKVLALAAGVWALSPLVLVAQEKPRPSSIGKWSIEEKNDPLDGKSTFIWSKGRQPGTGLFIAYRHTKLAAVNARPMHQFFISYHLGREMLCPHLEHGVPQGSVLQKSALVRWKLDDGPLHDQKYSIGCTAGRCASHQLFVARSIGGAGWIHYTI